MIPRERFSWWLRVSLELPFIPSSGSFGIAVFGWAPGGRRAAPSPSLPSIAVIVSGSASNCRWPAIPASPPRPASMRCPNSVWRRSQVRGCRAPAEDGRQQPRQGYHDAFASHYRPVRPAIVAFAPLAQRTAKKLLNDIEDAPLSLAIELEGQCYGPATQLGGFPRRGRSLRRQTPAKFSRKIMRGSRPLPSAQPAARRLNTDSPRRTSIA
jgi:hypothetical protein